MYGVVRLFVCGKMTDLIVKFLKLNYTALPSIALVADYVNMTDISEVRGKSKFFTKSPMKYFLTSRSLILIQSATVCEKKSEVHEN